MPTQTVTHVEDEHARRGKAPRVGFLYVALDCEHLHASSARYALAGVDQIVIGRAEQRSARRTIEGGTARLSLGLPDRWLSSTHACLSPLLGKWILVDEKSKNGTFVNGAPITRVELADGDVVEAGHVFFVFRCVEAPTSGAPGDTEAAGLPSPAPGLRTLVPQLEETFAKLARVAPSNVAVVVHGETGTGKELIARAVHQLSGRPGPFIAVNCGALPPALIESELFGHKKGAFSGATEDRPGLVRAAHRGTLFLDEIGDLPAAAQPAFLRVLQEREVVPVGATQPLPVDVRLVSASHRDLDALVAEGRFRADLLARLSGFALDLPPLRTRREEIGLIASDLLARMRPPPARDVRFALNAGRALMLHDWPLNVRELEKCLGAAVVLAGDGRIEAEHLPDGVRQSLDLKSSVVPDIQAPEEEERADRARPLSAAEERHKDELAALLREHAGNISAVARALGKARVQIQRWVKRYGLDPESFRA
jgi:sigma-54 dependent transcriptional regulator, acetoin dehydrogenase operon transcriptional activator AcoR